MKELKMMVENHTGRSPNAAPSTKIDEHTLLAPLGGYGLKSSGVLFLILFVSFNAVADTSHEIDHLLRFVASTDCEYVRNGERYSGTEAVKHIKKKYGYFRDDIETTEDFVKYSATKSKISGNHYQIHCKNQPSVKSSTWLLSELARYRANRQ